MRKLGIVLLVLTSFLTGASLLWAGGADNKTNWSAEYIGILNRNAATDSADIVMYNPAGVMKMENGLYFNLSGHYFPKDYNNQINGTDCDQDKHSIVPGVFTVYKKDKWAAFFGVSNVVGGGEVDFNKGNATTNFVKSGVMALNPIINTVNQEFLNAEAVGLGYTIGGAYSFNDMWSVSLGLRYVRSDREMSGMISLGSTFSPLATYVADVAFEEDAQGFGGVIGVNFSPSDDLNIGLHYDSMVKLDYEAEVERDTKNILPTLGVVHGKERSRNLPAILAAGVSYRCHPKLRVETNLTLYLNNTADFTDIAGTSRDESAVDNGYDLGIGFEYSLTDTFNVTLGYLYTNTGVEAKDMTPELPELNAHTIGAGLKYKLNNRLDLNFSLGHVFYNDESFVNQFGQTLKYEKEITFFGIGLQYRFL